MQERLKTKSLQISVFRLDPKWSLTSPSAVISNRFTDRNKIDRTLLPYKKVLTWCRHSFIPHYVSGLSLNLVSIRQQ